MANFITPRQSETLAFVRAYTAEHRMPPTVREVATHVGVTPRAAWDFLRALVRKGELVNRASGSRSFVLVEPTPPADAVKVERARIVALARRMLVYDSQREVSWHEVQDFIEAVDKA